MFYAVINGKEKKVFFSYEREERVVNQKDGTKVVQIHPQQTMCTVLNNEDNSIDGQGIAYCAAGDQFNYLEGRKLSLTRALVAAEIDTDGRRVIWNKFLNM